MVIMKVTVAIAPPPAVPINHQGTGKLGVLAAVACEVASLCLGSVVLLPPRKDWA